MGHARALLGLEGSRQVQAARDVIERQLSVRQTEEMVRRLLEPGSPRKTKRTADPDIRALQQKLAEKLGAKVRIRHGRGGKGQLTIGYQSLDELDGILRRIR
jgi:ParB family chromosome partitioning protein